MNCKKRKLYLNNRKFKNISNNSAYHSTFWNFLRIKIIHAPREDRTLDLQIMRLTRYLLRYRGR